MSLKDEIKRTYQLKLKKAIAANSKEEIDLYEQILRQYSDYDVLQYGHGIFTAEFLTSLKSMFLEKWKVSGYPLPALISVFLYGSWVRGTHTDDSRLNICVVYVRFDSNNKRVIRDTGFSPDSIIKIEDIKKNFKDTPISIDFQGKKREVDFYFKEITSDVITDFHSGPKIYL